MDPKISIPIKLAGVLQTYVPAAVTQHIRNVVWTADLASELPID
jgi:hypothetical protein